MRAVHLRLLPLTALSFAAPATAQESVLILDSELHHLGEREPDRRRDQPDRAGPDGEDQRPPREPRQVPRQQRPRIGGDLGLTPDRVRQPEPGVGRAPEDQKTCLFRQVPADHAVDRGRGRRPQKHQPDRGDRDRPRDSAHHRPPPQPRFGRRTRSG